MGRVVKNWKPDSVSNAIVAEHRYLFSGTVLANGEPAKYFPLCEGSAERRANTPYRVDEVVWVDRDGVGVRARIIMVSWESDAGNRRELYRVQFETAKDTWSKLWAVVYPGMIQRGYQLAGLAPDVP